MAPNGKTQQNPDSEQVVLEPKAEHQRMHERLKGFGFKALSEVQLPHKKAMIWHISKYES